MSAIACRAGVLLLIGWLGVMAGCDPGTRQPPVEQIGPAVSQVPSDPTVGSGHAVSAPRTYMTAVEALTVAYRQCQVRCAVLPPDFDGVVGPYALGRSVAVTRLVKDIAEATNTTVRTVQDVAVFEGRTPRDVTDAEVDAALKVLTVAEQGTARRAEADSSLLKKAQQGYGLPSAQDIYDLGQLHQARVIVPLSRLANYPDERVRLLAVQALGRLEGDFMRREWPGRVSIYELLADELDQQALLWAMEEGGPDGGVVWNLAASVLARARCPVLSRNTWWRAFDKTPGAMQTAIWAIGRVDDPSGAWSIRGRLANTFTNDPEDAYLAAMSLARREAWRLTAPSRSESAEVRRAAAFGAGFAPADSTAARELILRALDDADPLVRFLACQSAARIGGLAGLARLPDIAADAARPVYDRVAALTAIGTIHDDAAFDVVVKSAGDRSGAVRAAAARILGDIGGLRARDALLKLLTDPEPTVRAEAAGSLGRLGDPVSLNAVSSLLNPNVSAPGDVKIAAIIGLGRGRTPAAATALSSVAMNGKAPVRLRRYAIRALAQLHDHAGAATLVQLARVQSPLHDHEAVRYLDLPTAEAVGRELIPILTSGERASSASAANRLAELGYGPGVRALCEGSSVFDNSARMMHMWGAIRSRGAEATAALIEAASSPRWRIRRVAAVALGDRSDPRAVAALIELCSDPHSGVRHLAAQSLGVTGDPAGIPALIRLARTDPDTRAADAAVRALRRRDWADRDDVKSAFAELAGTPRDCGVPNPHAPSVRDQPDHSFVLRRWPNDPDDLSITNITYESSLTYDSDRGRIVQWGSHGRRADSPQTGQTWFYDVASNEWQRLADSRHWPNGTCLNWGTTYDPANRVVVSPKTGHGGHGWINSLRANLTDSVPWVLDGRTDQWRAARPVHNVGYSLGQVQGEFDTEHDLLLFHHGPVRAYDAYDNRWDSLPAKARPGYGRASAWDPVGGRLIALAPGGPEGMDTWAYDPAEGAWTNLRTNPGPTGLTSRLVYDSANHVMLGFASAGRVGGLRVWVYHLSENRWQALPAIYPAPRFSSLDCAYDSRHNVVVFSGGWASAFSGELTQRETWTYRYRRPDGPAVALPGTVSGARLVTDPGGQVRLNWQTVRGASGYRVLRGTGERPWQARLQEVGKPLEASATAYAERVDVPEGETVCWYRIEALSGDGAVLARSRLLRTRPEAVHSAWATVMDRAVQVGWTPSNSSDVVGYRVYRAEVNLGNPWSRPFKSDSIKDRLTLVSGEQPVTGTSWRDTQPPSPTGVDEPAPAAAGRTTGDTRTLSSRDLLGETAAPPAEPPGELHWPRTVAYVIRPVNKWGVEGGESPATLALPDVAGPVRVIPWADGRRLVVWPMPQAEGIVGWHVMRMDDWVGSSVYRYNGSPVGAVGFYDAEEFPTADRRRYYVVGVDDTGTLGIPSSGAWSHGFP